jgi:hypothetical protein
MFNFSFRSRRTLSAGRAPSRFVAALLQGLACLAYPGGVAAFHFIQRYSLNIQSLLLPKNQKDTLSKVSFGSQGMEQNSSDSPESSESIQEHMF